MYKTRNTRNKNKEDKSKSKNNIPIVDNTLDYANAKSSRSISQIKTELARITGSTIYDHYGIKYGGTLAIFRKDITNTLQIPDELYYLMFVKKQWWRYEFWSNDQVPSCKGEQGIAMFDHLFYYIDQTRNSHYNDILVVYILNNDSYWFCNFKQVRDFVYKKGTWYNDRYGTAVVGLSKNLFRQEPILFV